MCVMWAHNNGSHNRRMTQGGVEGQHTLSGGFRFFFVWQGRELRTSVCVCVCVRANRKTAPVYGH